jgi:hypothetical protein
VRERRKLRILRRRQRKAGAASWRQRVKMKGEDESMKAEG